LLVTEVCSPLGAKCENEEGGADQGVGQVEDGQEPDDRDGGPEQLEALHVLPEARHNPQNLPHRESGLYPVLYNTF